MEKFAVIPPEAAIFIEIQNSSNRSLEKKLGYLESFYSVIEFSYFNLNSF